MIRCTIGAPVNFLQASSHRGPSVERFGSLSVRQGKNGRLLIQVDTDAGLLALIGLDEVSAEELIERLESVEPEETDE